MGYCTPIQKFTGTKAERVRAMIQIVRKEQIRRNLKRLSKDKELVRLRKDYEISSKKASSAYAILQKKEDELGIILNSNNGNKSELNYRVCHVPLKDQKLLQKAQTLSDLGKKTESKKIIDTLISKYKLDERFLFE